MCRMGDIIVIKEFRNENGEIIKKHPFIVLSDFKYKYNNLKYNIITNMICSFHNEKHKSQKIKYKENLYVNSKSNIGKNLHQKDGFIKADQLYYFNEKDYEVIAHVDDYILNKLLLRIVELEHNKKIKIITTNI